MGTGQHLEQQHAQSVDVRLRGDFFTLGLFWRQVIERPDDVACLGQVFAFDVLGDAEVGQVGVAVLIQQDVAGFEIAMHDARTMGAVQCFADLGGDSNGSREIQRTFFKDIAHTAARQPAHDQVGALTLAPVII